MGIAVADKVLALLTALRPDEIRALPPETRRLFAQQCKRVAAIAEPSSPLPKTGILYDLRIGIRAD